MTIVPEYLANVFYLPSSESNKKPYKPRVITEGRTVTEKNTRHCIKKKKKPNPGKKKRRKIEKKPENKNSKQS